MAKILDATQPVDMQNYDRVTFQGPGDGADLEVMQSDHEDGSAAEPIPGEVQAQPQGDHWQLVLTGYQVSKRYVLVAGATVAVGEGARYAAGLPGTAPPAAPEGKAPAAGKPPPPPPPAPPSAPKPAPKPEAKPEARGGPFPEEKKGR